MKNTTLQHRPNIQNETSYDAILFNALRTVRRKISEETEKAPYMIFSNRTLEEMALYIPQSEEQLLQIHGVSDKKLKEYGKQFLNVLQRYAQEFNVQPKAIPSEKERKIQSVRDPQSTYGLTRALIEQHLPLTEIAQKREMKVGTVIAHIEELRKVDSNLDIDYLRPDSALINEVSSAYATCADRKLTTIYNALNAKYSFEYLRFVRLYIPQNIIV